MRKIESLTPAQEARLSEFCDKWLAIGLSTEPADRPKAEAAIRQAYRLAGLDEPRKIVWCGSPLAQGLTRAALLDDKLSKEIGDNVRDIVRDNVQHIVRDIVWDIVWDNVRHIVWDIVRIVGGIGYGQHDAHWLGYYEFFREVCGLTAETEKLTGLIEQAKHAGWYLPHQHVCWVSERHNILEIDEQGRLHSLTGPAVQYPDGWAIYAVHGVRVPERVIKQPHSITVAEIQSERNAEIRRIMLELYGQSRYLIDSGARLIHQDRYGKLWRQEIDNDEPLVMVQVKNSTPEPDGSCRDYFIRVNPAIETAHAAVAWSFSLSEREYAPEVET